LDFLNGFSKNAQISNFIKIRPVGAELFQADRRTDQRKDRHDEAHSRFSQFCLVGVRTTIPSHTVPILGNEYAIPAVASWNPAFNTYIFVAFTDKTFMRSLV